MASTPEDRGKGWRERREWALFIIAALGAGLGIFNTCQSAPPRPAELSAVWTVSESDYLAWVPPVSGTNDGKKNSFSKPFPVPITVSNYGELTAKGVELSITHPPNLALMSDEFDVSYQRVKGGTEPLVLTRISLGDLDPNESTSSLTSLYAVTENTLDMTIGSKTADDIPIEVRASVSYVVRLDVQLTAQDTPSVSQTLSLGLAPRKRFIELGQAYCYLDNDEVNCVGSQ